MGRVCRQVTAVWAPWWWLMTSLVDKLNLYRISHLFIPPQWLLYLVIASYIGELCMRWWEFEKNNYYLIALGCGHSDTHTHTYSTEIFFKCSTLQHQFCSFNLFSLSLFSTSLNSYSYLIFSSNSTTTLWYASNSRVLTSWLTCPIIVWLHILVHWKAVVQIQQVFWFCRLLFKVQTRHHHNDFDLSSNWNGW